MTAATQVRLQPGENRFRILPTPPPELMAKTRPRPTDGELEEKLQTCRAQYQRQFQDGSPKELQMVTLGQIAALEMVLGYRPDGSLPIICIM